MHILGQAGARNGIAQWVEVVLVLGLYVFFQQADFKDGGIKERAVQTFAPTGFTCRALLPVRLFSLDSTLYAEFLAPGNFLQMKVVMPVKEGRYGHELWSLGWLYKPPKACSNAQH